MAERFEFPFKENYAEIDGVRLHYVDEGTGPPIVMVHGQPTWSYLYRKMIPPLVAAGGRGLPVRRSRSHGVRPLGQAD